MRSDAAGAAGTADASAAGADRAPRVSVRLPSYNHGKYVRECIRSVLDQTYQDFEICVTDDGSTDDSVAAIRSFDDPRIRLVVFPENRGVATAVADCCARARGEYIAALCSDDAWEKDKLERQVAWLDAHPDCDAVFTRVRAVGEDGRPLGRRGARFEQVFEVEDRPRAEWLGTFFREGNRLCIPSAMIRRSVYESLDWQDPRLAQTPDVDLWIRFSLAHDLHVIDERLTRFRIRDARANESGDDVGKRRRGLFEWKQILDSYLRIDEVATLTAAFPECLTYGTPTRETIPYFLARVALASTARHKQLWGLETLFRAMGAPAFAAAVRRLHGFDFPDLHRMEKRVDPFRLRDWPRWARRLINRLRRA